MSTEIHPVDEILPVPRLLALGLQHVLVMYTGAVAVPLIIGGALKLRFPTQTHQAFAGRRGGH